MDRSTYSTHADLLSQVADSEAEAAEVRRVLSKRVTDAEITRRNAERLDAVESAVAAYKRAPWPIAPANHAHRHSPGCSRCESGLTRCTTPDACQLPERVLGVFGRIATRIRAAMTRKPNPTRGGDLVGIWALILGVWAAIVFALVATGVSL